MIKVLAVSRVCVGSEYRVRFLCIHKTVDINKVRMMMSKVTHPCYNIDNVASLFNKDDMYYSDYIVENSGVLCKIPLVQPSVKLKVSKIVNKSYFLDLLGKYNPELVVFTPTQICQNFQYTPFGWLYLSNIPLCIWKQSFNDNSIKEHFYVQGDILVYSFEKDIYILTDENVRHRPITLGELLTINYKSLECIKVIRSISQDSIYTEKIFAFDRVLRDWVLIRENEHVTVLGRKDR